MALMLPDELFDPLYDGEERADPEDIRLGLAVPDGWAPRTSVWGSPDAPGTATTTPPRPAT